MRLVMIEWTDSYGCSSSWQSMDAPLPAPRLMTCKSVGWLAHDGRDCKVIVPHVADVDGDAHQGCGDMTIPAAAVVRITDLASTRTRVRRPHRRRKGA